MKTPISRYWLDFVYVMTVKEIKARYKRVILGFFWAILNPILQMMIIGFFLRYLIPVKMDNYFFFLFAGLIPWNFFSYTVTQCTPLILYERSLIQKAKFPREALVLSVIFSNFFHLFVSLLLLLVGSIFIVKKFLIINIILLPFLLVWLLLLVIGLSLLLSALFVKYRDIKFIVKAIVPLWFYATPIIYTRELLPNDISLLLNLNPMTGIIELFQYIFYSSSDLLDFSGIIIGFTISVIIFLLGIYYFLKESQYFDDWL